MSNRSGALHGKVSPGGLRALAIIAIGLFAAGCEPGRQPSAENAGEPWASLRAMGDSLHRAAEVGEQADAAGSEDFTLHGGGVATVLDAESGNSG